ncbi:MAG: hypothetical protein GC160_13380 [Acidobacteria bacterium]|nr:hypothetical protein [Acidobacteriota bacterium]
MVVCEGWHRSLVPYDAIVCAKAADGSLSAGVYSTQRIEIETTDASRYLIAPRQQARFLAELARHAPQILGKPMFGSVV